MGTANTYVCTYVVTGNGQNELQYTLFLIDTHKIHVEYYYCTVYVPECNFGMACHSTRPA